MIRPCPPFASLLPRLYSTRIIGGLPSRSFSISSSERAKLSHEERTSAEPPQLGFQFVNVVRIKEINPDIRLLHLSVQNRKQGLKFLPGQWLDIFMPGVPMAGGFTITSTPSLAWPATAAASLPPNQHVIAPPPPELSLPFVELAVRRSEYAPARWIWQAPRKADRTQLAVRVRGSLVWPPPVPELNTLLFIAGGVGINPLISILTHLYEKNAPPDLRTHFIYATRAPINGTLLFLDRLLRVAALAPATFDLTLYVTGLEKRVERVEAQVKAAGLKNVKVKRRRVDRRDVLPLVGARLHENGHVIVENVPAEVMEERRKTVAYLCGPQPMTNKFVKVLEGVEGLEKERVLCEKWW